MKAIDRRRLLGGILCGAVAAAAGLALTSAPIDAMPFDAQREMKFRQALSAQA